jgi:hypothetical protein
MQTQFPKWKLILFALLSACDFIITYSLLSHSDGEVYETNPLANQWLQANGWVGLAAFKALIVFTVGVIATYVYYRRPRTAHDLLALACGAVVVAVVSGMTICITTTGKAAANERGNATRNLPRPEPGEKELPLDYNTLLDIAASKLATKKTDLNRAVELLHKSSKANDAKWIESLRKAYPGLEDRSLLAADLIQHSVGLRIRTPIAKDLAERLEKEFVALYSVTPHLPYQQILHLSPSATVLADGRQRAPTPQSE